MSRLLEVSIGLCVVLFTLATVVSALVEAISHLVANPDKLTAKRFKGLLGEAAGSAWDNSATGDRYGLAHPADPTKAVVDYLFGVLLEGPLPTQQTPLKSKLSVLIDEQGRTQSVDLERLRVGLTRWFGLHRSEVLQGIEKCKRRIELGLAAGVVIVANMPIDTLVRHLWTDAPARDLLNAEAAKIAALSGDPLPAPSFDDALSKLASLGVPGGWHGAPTEWQWVTWPLGWIVTILLVSRGAAYWRGALSSLIALRSGFSSASEAVERLPPLIPVGLATVIRPSDRSGDRATPDNESQGSRIAANVLAGVSSAG